MDAEPYVDVVHSRMINKGYSASTQTLPDGAALVGYRSDFRLAWLATKLNLFVAVKGVPAVTPNGLSDFATSTLAYGKQTKGRFRGLQTGVGVIAALVSTRVDDAARDLARHDLVRNFAAFAWPVIVDLTAGQVLAQEGNPKIGGVYNAWMREQIEAVLPPPREA